MSENRNPEQIEQEKITTNGRLPKEENIVVSSENELSELVQTELPIESIGNKDKDTNRPKYQKKQYKKGAGKVEGTKSNEKTISKGNMLEYRMKRLVFHMGYFAKIGIDIRTSYDDSSDVITDLDVYGLYVHKDFTSKSLWVDCKSGGVEVHKRISWIKGVMTQADVNDVIFVAGGARTTVKQYARKSGIQILDLSIIENLEEHYGIASDNWKGSWNPQTQFNKINNLARISLPTNEPFKKIAKFISSDYWINDNYSQAKKTITALRELVIAHEVSATEEQSEVIRWGIYELVGLLLLSLLDIAREVYYFSDKEKRETVLEGLSSSEIPNRIRNEMFDTALKYAYRMVRNQYPDLKMPERIPSINLGPPKYFESFYDFIHRITNNPFNYFDSLRFIDYVLMEFDLQTQELNDGELHQMFNNYDDVVLGAKTLLNFVCHIANVPRTFFQLVK